MGECFIANSSARMLRWRELSSNTSLDLKLPLSYSRLVVRQGLRGVALTAVEWRTRTEELSLLWTKP